MVRQLLRDPNAFMDRKVGQPKLRMEFIVVFTVGALSSVGHLYVGLGVIDAMEDIQIVQLPIVGMIVEPIIGAFLLWLGYSFGLHIVSNRVYNTRTPIFRLMKPTAWALIPIGVGNLLQSGIRYVIYRGMDYETVIENGDTSGSTSNLDVVLNEGASDPLFVLLPVISILAAVMTGYLLVYAVQNAKELPRDDARKAVGVLVGIHVVYIAWTAVNTIGL